MIDVWVEVGGCIGPCGLGWAGLGDVFDAVDFSDCGKMPGHY
jgi:hypothetical protein